MSNYKGVYKTASETLQLGQKPSYYTQKYNQNSRTLNSNYRNSSSIIKENFENPVKAEEKNDLGNPSVWGSSFWFSLHNGAAHYPIKATSFTSEKMKNFILGIPFILPCSFCSDHALSYLEKQEYNGKINEAITGREALFHFFWEFHNHVNTTIGKSIITLDEAKKLYQYEN